MAVGYITVKERVYGFMVNGLRFWNVVLLARFEAYTLCGSEGAAAFVVQNRQSLVLAARQAGWSLLFTARPLPMESLIFGRYSVIGH